MPHFALALVLICHGLPLLAEDPVPSAFAKNRYESLRVKSPFAVATAAAPTVSQASFAANWYVSGVARVGDENYVTIKSRDLATQFSLFAGQSVGGVALASVTWSDQVGKSTVILRKGTETARLEFNEAQLRAAATTGVAKPTPGAKQTAANAAGGNPNPTGVNVAAVNPDTTAAALNGAAAPRRRILPIQQPR